MSGARASTGPPAILSAVFGRLTRSRLVARAHFGAIFPPLRKGEHLFDVATLALRRVALERIPTGARVLEVGTGSFAVLAIWLWRRGCRVRCTEIDADIAQRARETVQLNCASIEVECQPFLGAAPCEVDFVLFNPPYVRTAIGERRRLPRALRSQWDGGADGVDVLREFLAEFARRGGAAKALVGLNDLHVGRKRVVELLAATPELALREVVRHPRLPASVYFLERTKSPSARKSSPVE